MRFVSYNFIQICTLISNEISGPIALIRYSTTPEGVNDRGACSIQGTNGWGEQHQSLHKKALMQGLETSHCPKQDCPRSIGRKGGCRNSFQGWKLKLITYPGSGLNILVTLCMAVVTESEKQTETSPGIHQL